MPTVKPDKTRVSADYRKPTPTLNDRLATVPGGVAEFVDEGILRNYNEAETGPERVLGLARDVVPMVDMIYRAENGDGGEVTGVLNFLPPGAATLPGPMVKMLAKARAARQVGKSLGDDELLEMAKLEEREMRKNAQLKQPSMMRRFLENITDEDLNVDRAMRQAGYAPNEDVFTTKDLNDWIDYLTLSGADAGLAANEIKDMIYAASTSQKFTNLRQDFLRRRRARQSAADLLRTEREAPINMFEYFEELPSLNDVDDFQTLLRLKKRVDATDDKMLRDSFAKTYDRLIKNKKREGSAVK